MTQELRVQYKGGSVSGIVRTQLDGKTLVYWGSADKREFTSWVDDDEIEAYPNPVYQLGEKGTDQKVLVYDPEGEVWKPLLKKLPGKTRNYVKDTEPGKKTGSSTKKHTRQTSSTP